MKIEIMKMVDKNKGFQILITYMHDTTFTKEQICRKKTHT